MNKEYRVCQRCIMDTTDPDIQFDENGTCNHCRAYDDIAGKYVLTGEEAEQKLTGIVNEIKRAGKNDE